MGYYFHKTLNKSIMMCVDEAVNLQRGYKILIMGGGALAVGIILTMAIFLTFKQTSFNINTGIDVVSPRKSIFKTSEVNRGEKMAIGISSKPSDIPMNLQIIERPGLAKILDVNFTGSLFENFMPNRDGEDTIMITNLGSKEVSANTVLGNSDFFDSSGQPKIFLGAAALSGVFLSFAGVVILILGGIILFIDRRRAKKMKAQ
jgi:hypothetical protein